MLRKLLCLSALCCSLGAVEASSRIPLRTVPHEIRIAVQHYLPGANLTTAGIDADDYYGPIYRCRCKRLGRTGSVAVSSLGVLVDLNEPLTIRTAPRSIRRTIWHEARGGRIRYLALRCQSGREVYRVKADYGPDTNREVFLIISQGNRVLSRSVSGKWLFAWL
ncbi:MAG TPA: hypothetical protein VF020_18635 [Chthoniobacterales bacterium]